MRSRRTIFMSNNCIKQLFDTVNRRASGRGATPVYTDAAVLRDLPPRARWYTIGVIALGAVTFATLVPRATLTPVPPLLFFIVLSSLTSAFKVHFPIASGSNMSVSYIVDIAVLILRGPHAGMIVGAASGLTQSTLNQPAASRNPLYRTLFNISILVLTAEASGQVYVWLGGTPSTLDLVALAGPLSGMAFTYFFVNTVPIAIAIGLATNQSAWRIWRSDFLPNVPSYILGAAAAAVVLAVTESSGYWLALLLTAAPLYLTYKMYRTGLETEARQGAILEAAHDAIITMDSHLAIREFNPAAEQMFGHRRSEILGRHVDILLHPDSRTEAVDALVQYLHTGPGPAARPAARVHRRAHRRHRFPVRIDGGPRRLRDPPRDDGLRPRHHRAAAPRRTAAAVAEARSHRPAGRRRVARLQQHPHEHHGLGRPAPRGRRAMSSCARRSPKSSSPSSEAPR